MKTYIMTLTYRDYTEIFKINEDQKRLVEQIKDEWFESDTTVTFFDENDYIIDVTQEDEPFN